MRMLARLVTYFMFELVLIVEEQDYTGSECYVETLGSKCAEIF